MNIKDSAFDRQITLREAYRAMDRLVAAHVGRGPVSTVEFLAYVGLTESGNSGDPAALHDYLAAVEEISARSVAP